MYKINKVLVLTITMCASFGYASQQAQDFDAEALMRQPQFSKGEEVTFLRKQYVVDQDELHCLEEGNQSEHAVSSDHAMSSSASGSGSSSIPVSQAVTLSRWIKLKALNDSKKVYLSSVGSGSFRNSDLPNGTLVVGGVFAPQGPVAVRKKRLKHGHHGSHGGSGFSKMSLPRKIAAGIAGAGALAVAGVLVVGGVSGLYILAQFEQALRRR